MLHSLNKALKRYLSIGTNRRFDRTTNQQLFVSNLFSFLGYIVTLILAVSSYVREDFVLAIVLVIASFVFLFCHHIHRFAMFGDTIKISTRIVFVAVTSLLIYLVYYGGNANTGPLWIYILPPIAFFFSGLKKGLITLGIFVVILSLMFFYPDNALLSTSYSLEFKTRIFYSFLTVAFLFGFYEYARQQSFEDIRKLSEKFEKQAMHDPLTGLSNRRGMRHFLEHEYNRSRRANTPLSLLLVDIDKFKKINDEYLHDGGDHVLEELAKLFIETIRSQDKVARWGGEEFLFLLPDTSANDAYVLAEKLREAVMNYDIKFAGKKISVTISTGLNEIEPGVNIDQAINSADHHLYEAKSKGRNQTQPCINSSEKP
ncbi:GGDEF domain-containing protein [Glaciecola sp. MH2013]|uniref:GGDEF domain-containing protein n=1 Tax=Glaciecola sp. MH2013 TaxID=2785524 RepID=UPI00189F1DDC|nr:GGDEF domain-containing protein [Glaciecola sp. MH2013]MBF7073199.1 GGDEF domain-containing protein [Glaciecola sp. MH2013]